MWSVYRVFGIVVAVLAILSLSGCPKKEPPKVAFLHLQEWGTLSVQFTDVTYMGPGENPSWAWDFGDGGKSTSNEQNPLHTFPAAGNYNVKLKVTTSEGYSEATNPIVVEPASGSEGEGEGEGEGEVETECCPAGSLYSQPPSAGELKGASYSDESGNNIMFESFSGVTGPIGAVYWWGVESDTQSPCERTPNTFGITFFADNAGAPGDEVAAYDGLTVTKQVADLTLESYTVYRYHVLLDTPCNLASGWVSIYGTGETGCLFKWMASDTGDGKSVAHMPSTGSFTTVGPDLAFCLAGADYTLAEFWPLAVGNQWRWKTYADPVEFPDAQSYTGALTVEAALSGYSVPVWQLAADEGLKKLFTDTFGTAVFDVSAGVGYLAVVEGAYYVTTVLADLGELPSTNKLFRIPFAADLTPGVVNHGIYSEQFTAGALTTLLPEGVPMTSFGSAIGDPGCIGIAVEIGVGEFGDNGDILGYGLGVLFAGIKENYFALQEATINGVKCIP